MMERDALVRLLEMSGGQWGQYALTRDSLWYRLTPEERADIVRQAQHTGLQAAKELTGRLCSWEPETLCRACGVTVTEEAELNGCGLYLFARFQEPDQIFLYEKTIQTVESFVCQNLPERFHCSVRRIILAHELFHVVELQDPELPTRNMAVPILKLGRHSWRRKLTEPSEIAAMSFAAALVDTPFYPQALDVLLLCATERDRAEERIVGILKTFGEEGKS